MGPAIVTRGYQTGLGAQNQADKGSKPGHAITVLLEHPKMLLKY